MPKRTRFARRLQEIRKAKGIGLKSLAPELGVSYTYLSKIENSKATPSSELLQRMAAYFVEDSDELLVLADEIPSDVRRILQRQPREALDFLRKRFGGASGRSRTS